MEQRTSHMRPRLLNAAVMLVLAIALGRITAPSAQAQAFGVLYDFKGQVDGGYPLGGIVRDSAGNLYGTTPYGGAYDAGTVFKISSGGKETTLHSFCSSELCTDGNGPNGLIRDAAGNLYGTTGSGGAHNYGTVFKMSEAGEETVLYSFLGGNTDGCNPLGGLLRDKAGNLYGTTEWCGADSQAGTIFKIDASGNETVLHDFCPQGGQCTDGENPSYTSLAMDKAGNLYGVTAQGGTTEIYGVLYKLDQSGTFTVLHNFSGGAADGCNPVGTPAVDKNGNLHGAAKNCGTSGQGILWKVDAAGDETVLHNFTGGVKDGAHPYASALIEAKGQLVGDTMEGGALNLGTVYELDAEGSTSLLHSFRGSDGEYPMGSLIRDSKGHFYGTTLEGGKGSFGTVWKMTP
jgi:uncharacterized repeat protein (TIGR03803 family)